MTLTGPLLYFIGGLGLFACFDSIFVFHCFNFVAFKDVLSHLILILLGPMYLEI